MANKTFQGRIIQKHDTKANWDKATKFIPLKGEIIIYDDLNKIKIGDGTTTVVNLPYSTTTDYNDLSNKPTIPSVGNGTLTIQKNGTKVDTFSANATTDKTINIEVPVDFVVNVDNISAGYTSDKTFDEIYEAIKANQHIICYYKEQIYYLQEWEYSQNRTPFVRFCKLAGNYLQQILIPRVGDITYSSSYFQETSNFTTKLDSTSTDIQYPSAKTVYDSFTTANNNALSALDLGKTVANNLSNYLPLTGGTMTGDINLPDHNKKIVMFSSKGTNSILNGDGLFLVDNAEDAFVGFEIEANTLYSHYYEIEGDNGDNIGAERTNVKKIHLGNFTCAVDANDNFSLVNKGYVDNLMANASSTTIITWTDDGT